VVVKWLTFLNFGKLKFPLIQSFLAEIESELLNESSHLSLESICQKIAIIEINHEILYPWNVGLLFFNDMPDKFIPYCQIDIVQFASNTKISDKLTEKIFKGPIGQQILDVLRFIKNVIIQEQVIKVPNQAEAIRYFNYPFIALEKKP
jgi:ATP-dependent DNA helicase RecG